MPTYEFRCPDGHTFDRFYRKISDAVSEVSCEVCGKPAVRQVSGAAGIAFKGSGFYLTDYGKNAHRTGTDGVKADTKRESGDSAVADSSGGGEKSSESKPASDAGSKESAPASAGASDTASVKKGGGGGGGGAGGGGADVPAAKRPDAPGKKSDK